MSWYLPEDAHGAGHYNYLVIIREKLSHRTKYNREKLQRELIFDLLENSNKVQEIH